MPLHRPPLTRARLFACVWAIGLLTLLALPMSAGAAWHYQGDFGTAPGNGQLTTVNAVTRDASNNIYVTDSGSHRIQKFNSSGTHLLTFGGPGVAKGKFRLPSGIAVDSAGNIWVVDLGNRRIQKFNSSGVFQLMLNTWGHDDGALVTPWGIAVDAADNIYVTDQGRDDIQKFSSAGTFITSFGSVGSANGQLNDPRGIAIKASDGSIYVADTGNNRVQQFNSSGSYVAKFGSYGVANGEFATVQDVALDSTGRVYVVDLTSRVQRFAASTGHAYSTQIAAAPLGWGSQARISMSAITIDSAGNVYAVELQRDKVLKYNSALTFQIEFGSNGTGHMSVPGQTSVAPDGTIYTVDLSNQRVYRYNSTGTTIINTWGLPGTAGGEFNSPMGVAIAPDGTVYVADYANSRVQRFTATGTHLTSWGTQAASTGNFLGITGVAVAPDSSVYTIECFVPLSQARVQRFSATGAFISTFGSFGSADGQFTCPQAIDIASDGSIYVVDKNAQRVSKFNSAHTFQLKFGTPGMGPGQLANPTAVSAVAGGDVFIGDSGSDMVSRFTTAGVYVDRFGYNAIGRTSLGMNVVYGVEAVSNSMVYVTEAGNNRISRWNSGTTTISVSGTALRNELGSTKWSGCDGSTQNIKLSSNGGTPITASCNATTGAFTFPSVPRPITGDPLVVWMSSGDAEGATYYVVEGSIANISGLNVVQDRVTVDGESDDATAGVPTFAAYDAVDDPDLPVSTAGGNILIPSTMELHIETGVYFNNQTTDISTGSVHVENGAVFGDGQPFTLTLTGTGTGNSCLDGPRISAPLCLDTDAIVPSFALDVLHDPADPTRAVAVAGDIRYIGVELNGLASYVLGTKAGQTITAQWAFVLNLGQATVDPWHPDLKVSGLFINGGQISGLGCFDLDVAVNVHGNGRINLPCADVTHRTVDPMNYFGPDWGPDWTFGTLNVEGGTTRRNFGTAGHVTLATAAVETPVKTVSQGDDVWVVYNLMNGGNLDWAVRKYNGAGYLDDSFGGGDGIQEIVVAGTDTAANAMVTHDGHLIISGQVGTQWAVKRINGSTGAVDWSYLPALTGSANAIVSTRDEGWDIIVGGTVTSGTASWRVQELDLHTGVTLGTTRTWTNGGLSANVVGMCSNPWDDAVFVVGKATTGVARDWAVAKLEYDWGGSTWDWAPMINGVMSPNKINTGGSEDSANTCYSQGDDVIFGGTSGNGSTTDVGHVRAYWFGNGTLHTDWGVGGMLTFDGPGQDYLTSFDGYHRRMYAVGGDSGGTGGRSWIRALDGDGKVDATFNNDAGVLYWDGTSGADRAVSISQWFDYYQVLSMQNGVGDWNLQQIDAQGTLQDSQGATGTGRLFVFGRSGNTIHLTGDLNIGKGVALKQALVDLRVYDGEFDVEGDVNVHATDGQLRLADERPLTVGGSLNLPGRFWNEGGTVVMRPRAKRVDIDVAAATRFNNLTIDGTEAATHVLMDSAVDIEVNGAFRATGRSCTDPLRIRGTSGSWTLNNNLGTTSGNYLDLLNTTASPPRAVANSWGTTGTNPGMTFNTPCVPAALLSPPESLRVNTVKHNRSVRYSPTPALAWTNRTGASVDRADYQVLSSSPNGLQALYHFNLGTELVDSSGKGNTLTGDLTSPATGKFSEGRQAALAQTVTAPALPVTSDYTVDAWFKRGPFTGGDVAFPVIIDRCGAGCTEKAYELRFDSGAGLLQGRMTSDGGTALFTAETAAAKYLDNEWHHVAMTYDKAMVRLYVDGEPVGHDMVYGSPDIGAWQSRIGGNLNGAFDEVSVRDVALSASEIRGYVRTKQPQMQVMHAALNQSFTSVGDGVSQSFSYAGSAGALAKEGARWWAQARYRTTGAVWSSWSALDWFETTLENETTVSLPGGPNVGLGSVTPGTDAHTEFIVRAQTTGNLGWSMYAYGEDDSYAMSNGLSGANNQIPRRTTPSWPTGTAGFAGLTVLNAWGGKGAPWCGGISGADYDNQCYLWPSASTGLKLHSFTGYDLAARDVEVSVRLNPGPATNVGSYTGRLDFIVVPNV